MSAMNCLSGDLTVKSSLVQASGYNCSNQQSLKSNLLWWWWLRKDTSVVHFVTMKLTHWCIWWLGICTVTATQLFQTVKVTIKMTDLPSSGSVCPYFSPSACKSQRYSRNPSAPHSFTLQPHIPSHRLKRNTHALKLGVEVSSCLVPFDPLRSQKEARADRGHGSVQYLGFDDSLRQT